MKFISSIKDCDNKINLPNFYAFLCDSFIVEIIGIIRIARIMNFSVKISIAIVYFNIILIYKTIIKQSTLQTDLF